MPARKPGDRDRSRSPAAGTRQLVEIALQHGGEGPIFIECAEAEDVEVRVIDSGYGRAAEDWDRVRRGFERGRGAPAGGIGLGLSIAEAAIRPAGGVLELYQHKRGFAAVMRFPAARTRYTVPDPGFAVDGG